MDRMHSRRFPTPIRHDGRDYLTTDQVSKVLGVKTSTIYSYVSRGRLHSQRISGHDGSVFAVDEVERLRDGVRHRPPAGVAERIATQLTLLRDDRLHYRGVPATDLARDETLEGVAALLWQRRWTGGADPAVAASVRALAGPASRGLDRIRLVVDLLGARDPLRHKIDDESVTRRAAAVIGTAVDVIGDGPSEGSLAQRLWPRLTDEPATVSTTRLLDAALILLADHDMSAGTVAARVGASARGSVYAVLGAGLGAFDGPMHGGATTLAYRFLAGALDDPTAALAEAHYGDVAIPGTGHVVYRHHDPRAECLIAMLGRIGGGDRRVMAALAAVVDSLAEGDFVNSDLALAALALRFRMRPDAAETIFAIARMVGWVAHALEEYRAPRLRFRPEGIYTGVHPQAR
ncbi:helix-turn-helix domain-containing protein [Gordonia desulfuricans]|uniref:citrate synthase (unknown stereospecificity) n=1 Tax=Gordonia desulfuricans TaxID=89051 RepID=A0A7K3LK26_9ACTN|nr:citrate synthase [Gordonia desulfuricans]NDK88558.1 helix-turn-helix domain-containing protein [Gordonia desulfuricans]